MGVNGFANITNDSHCETIPVSALKGKRLAVDIHGVGYRFYPAAKKEVVRATDFSQTVEIDHEKVQDLALQHILRHLALYIAEGVELICCFDSKNHPRKQQTLEKRHEQKEKPKDELQMLKQQMLQLQPLERLMHVPRYSQLLSNHNYIPLDFWNKLRDILDGLGYPVYRAVEFFGQGGNGDGEALAATFCINGYCWGAVTKDSDFHMYGGARAIIESTFVAGTLMLKVRYLERILADLGCNYQQFVDACILGGTDYNKGVFRVAVKTAVKKLRDHQWKVEGLGVDDDYPETRALIEVSCQAICPVQVDFDRERLRGLGLESLNFHGLTAVSKLYQSLLNGVVENHTESLFQPMVLF